MTFIANIITQVIERHIVHDLEKIFSPVTVNNLSEAESQAIASDPSFSKEALKILGGSDCEAERRTSGAM